MTPSPTSNTADTLAEVMQRLYNSEINCGLSSFWDGGWTVWIGDELNGRHAEALFDHVDFDKIPQWLLDQADILVRRWNLKAIIGGRHG